MDGAQVVDDIIEGEQHAPADSPSPPPSSISGSILPQRLLANPLAGLQKAELQELGRKFAADKGLGTGYEELFQRAAVLAQNPSAFEEPDSEFQTNDRLHAERDALKREFTHKWDQPKSLYALVITCALGAVVQGWDELVPPFLLLFATFVWFLEGVDGGGGKSRILSVLDNEVFVCLGAKTPGCSMNGLAVHGKMMIMLTSCSLELRSMEVCSPYLAKDVNSVLIGDLFPHLTCICQ